MYARFVALNYNNCALKSQMWCRTQIDVCDFNQCRLKYVQILYIKCQMITYITGRFLLDYAQVACVETRAILTYHIYHKFVVDTLVFYRKNQ